MTRPRYLPDNFTPALLGSIGLASFLPVRGYAAQGFEWLTTAAIALLALSLAMTTWASRALRFSKEDEIAIVFCGSKKAWPAVCRWPRCCSLPTPWG